MLRLLDGFDGVERQDEEAADVVYDGGGGCLLNKVKMTSFSPYW